MQIKNYIKRLVSRGRYHFTLEELVENLSLSRESIWVSLCRLKKEGEIGSPAKGYYIIIPLEYRSLGSLPPDQFLPDLMAFLELPYYVGLLSAGLYYGAAHQQPQIFQVMIPKARRNLVIGKVRVGFYTNKYLDQCPIRKFNTARSVLSVSSPEATAFDLVAYPHACGGLSNVLTVIGELVESMHLEDFKQLLSSKKGMAVPVLQRLGYVFEQLQQEDFADIVELYLKGLRLDKTVLDPICPLRAGDLAKRWKLIINTNLESDL